MRMFTSTVEHLQLIFATLIILVYINRQNKLLTRNEKHQYFSLSELYLLSAVGAVDSSK